jgi:hypothetical protein
MQILAALRKHWSRRQLWMDEFTVTEADIHDVLNDTARGICRLDHGCRSSAEAASHFECTDDSVLRRLSFVLLRPVCSDLSGSLPLALPSLVQRELLDGPSAVSYWLVLARTYVAKTLLGSHELPLPPLAPARVLSETLGWRRCDGLDFADMILDVQAYRNTRCNEELLQSLTDFPLIDLAHLFALSARTPSEPRPIAISRILAWSADMDEEGLLNCMCEQVALAWGLPFHRCHPDASIHNLALVGGNGTRYWQPWSFERIWPVFLWAASLFAKSLNISRFRLVARKWFASLAAAVRIRDLIELRQIVMTEMCSE